MAKIKRAVAARKRKKDYFKAAKGYCGGRRRLWRTVRNAVDRARTYAYRDRRIKKRDIRRLWIARINAACRQLGLNYSQFVYGAQLADISINRKVLANIAIQQPQVFEKICSAIKDALEKTTKPMPKIMLQPKIMPQAPQPKTTPAIANLGTTDSSPANSITANE